MDNRIRASNLDEIRHATQDKEHELSELDLLIANFHIEYSRLIGDLSRLRAQLYEEEKVTPASGA